MATNTSTDTASHDSSVPRLPDPHAIEAHSGGTSAGFGSSPASPAGTRLLHPLRPAERRAARIPRHGGKTPARRTTPAGTPPSSAPLPLAAPSGARLRDVVPPTVLPDQSGDLLGLPDLRGFSRSLEGAARQAWAWLRSELRASAELDARVRARREEDWSAMGRAGANVTRLM